MPSLFQTNKVRKWTITNNTRNYIYILHSDRLLNPGETQTNEWLGIDICDLRSEYRNMSSKLYKNIQEGRISVVEEIGDSDIFCIGDSIQSSNMIDPIELIPDGETLEYDIVHNLDRLVVGYKIYSTLENDYVEVAVSPKDSNTITLHFGSAPSSEDTLVIQIF